jgi:hypothetical protein
MPREGWLGLTSMDTEAPDKADSDGRKAEPLPGHASLEEVHGSVAVPSGKAGFWRQWRAYTGPALLVSVGYMDPGNWGTDLAGGAQYKYGLLWVVALASFMAVILQVISARLGLVTGRDLAQCCREHYPAWTRWPNWIAMEIAIGATDLAESLGSAVALNLLFHIPLSWAIIITAVRCAAAAGAAGPGHADDRSGGRGFRGDHRHLLRHRDFRAAADPAGLCGNGPGPDPAPASVRPACSWWPSA